MCISTFGCKLRVDNTFWSIASYEQVHIFIKTVACGIVCNELIVVVACRYVCILECYFCANLCCVDCLNEFIVAIYLNTVQLCQVLFHVSLCWVLPCKLCRRRTRSTCFTCEVANIRRCIYFCCLIRDAQCYHKRIGCERSSWDDSTCLVVDFNSERTAASIWCYPPQSVISLVKFHALPINLWRTVTHVVSNCNVHARRADFL